MTDSRETQTHTPSNHTNTRKWRRRPLHQHTPAHPSDAATDKNLKHTYTLAASLAHQGTPQERGGRGGGGGGPVARRRRSPQFTVLRRPNGGGGGPEARRRRTGPSKLEEKSSAHPAGHPHSHHIHRTPAPHTAHVASESTTLNPTASEREEVRGPYTGRLPATPEPEDPTHNSTLSHHIPALHTLHTSLNTTSRGRRVTFNLDQIEEAHSQHK